MLQDSKILSTVQQWSVEECLLARNLLFAWEKLPDSFVFSKEHCTEQMTAHDHQAGDSNVPMIGFGLEKGKKRGTKALADTTSNTDVQ